MNAYELELPKHLFIESPTPCGTGKRVIYVPENLISWSESGRGDAIARLCHEVYERRLADVDSWESDRILHLEDEWLSADNDEDLSEEQFDQACENVMKEAETKRAELKEQMIEHMSEVEKLVEDARTFIAAHEPPQYEDNMVAYLFALGIIAAAGYLLLFT